MTALPEIEVRLLGTDDAEAYQALRLEGLLQAPTAFGSSYEEESGFTLEQVAERLTGSLPDIASFGAFRDGKLVGMVTLIANRRPKTQHRAMIAAMYVTPSQRGLRIGRRLLDAVVAYGQSLPQVETIILAVTVGNEAARHLYLGAGFQLYALEPRYLKIDGAYYDLEWLERTL